MVYLAFAVSSFYRVVHYWDIHIYVLFLSFFTYLFDTYVRVLCWCRVHYFNQNHNQKYALIILSFINFCRVKACKLFSSSCSLYFFLKFVFFTESYFYGVILMIIFMHCSFFFHKKQIAFNRYLPTTLLLLIFTFYLTQQSQIWIKIQIVKIS